MFFFPTSTSVSLSPLYRTMYFSSLYSKHIYDCHDHHDERYITIWSVTLELSVMVLEVAFTPLEASFVMFILQASLTIVTYDHRILS